MHSSTREPADLVQAWSSPLLAQGDIVMTHRPSKSKRCCIAICLHLYVLVAQVYTQRVALGAEEGLRSMSQCLLAEQKKPAPILTGNILDWSFTYGIEPGIWIATELAW